jgi:hypothetical protein
MSVPIRRGALLGLVAGVLGAVHAGPASASQLIDRNATGVTLQLNARGEALLTYRAGGTSRHVLAWGAINARPSSAGARQVKLQLDYSGGYGKYFEQNPDAQLLVGRYRSVRGSVGHLVDPVVERLRQARHRAGVYWETAFHGGCGPYHGPPLAWGVIACTAPDGSNWAVQEWQRELPDYGVTPTASQSVLELRLSHWMGPLPVLSVHTDWAWHRWDHLYGEVTYLGRPTFGFHSTRGGNPLDSYGRNVYIDTYDSVYGGGWRRENSALTHTGTGVFCYSVDPHGNRPAGTGARYRITVIGPGVTPDLRWEGPAPGRYDARLDREANAQISALGDRLCRAN